MTGLQRVQETRSYTNKAVVAVYGNKIINVVKEFNQNLSKHN
jgi:hypothetical protein